MSKNITIQQDGTPINFSASAIETPLVGQGTTDWQPEDEERMAKVLVRKNGTYSASGINVPGIVEAVVKLTKTGAAIEVTQRDVLGPVQPVNIAITEGDRAVNLTAKTLRIPGQSDGYERFLPALTGRVGEKTINREGTYKADNDGYYAYSKLTVNISDSGGGGFDEPVDHIRITTPPRKLQYANDETLDFTGIVVTAYNAENRALGTIPYGELIFPISTAHVDESEISFDGSTLDLELEYDFPISFNHFVGLIGVRGNMYMGKKSTWTVSVGPGEGYVLGATETDGLYVCIISDEQRARVIDQDYDSMPPDYNIYQRVGELEIDGHTYYYNCMNNRIMGWDENPMQFPYLTRPIAWQNAPAFGRDLIRIVYASSGSHSGEGEQSIPVQWIRPEDDAVLEDSFTITVTAEITPTDN